MLLISNVGGKNVRVNRISISVKRGNEDLIQMPGNAYFQNQNDSQSLVFTPFKLKPNEEWGHFIQFYSEPSRLDENQYRQMESAIRTNVFNKRALIESKEITVEADPDVVVPLLAFFEKRFRWFPGEYDLTLTVEAEPSAANIKKSLRFTLYESDSAELRARSEDYKFGAGVFFHTPNHDGLPIQLVSQ